ncbi:MAG: 4-hydroxy-tetrahydrodipicolinate synthase [Chlamydiia bacterium]|nr:4-hydroxy-tetrahydrodipicolinate synthase [Chlamydiia bacterium]
MFSGTIVALVTPFTNDLEVDYFAIRQLVDWHLSEGVDGIVVCGSTGEGITLSKEEKFEILKVAIETSKGRIPIIMNTGCSNTRESIVSTKRALDLGADGCLAVVPYYNRPSDEGCFQHFYEISRVGLPLIVYHHPGRTGIKLHTSTLRELVALPNIIGIKEASGETHVTQDVLAKCKTTIFSGDDSLTYSLMDKGAQGVISVVGNVIPKTWSTLVNCYLNKEYDEAFRIQSEHQKLNEALNIEINPQGIKYAMSLLKLCNPYMRLPLVMPSDETKSIIRKSLEDLSLI